MASNITLKKEEIMARFGGMGFHNTESGLYRKMSDRQFHQVVGKIYRDLHPGFSRMGGGYPTWTKEEMDDFAEYCKQMQCVTDATIYLTGHCVRYHSHEEMLAYAKNVADKLEYLIREKGISNIEIYCMSNELSLDDWGDLNFEMETFKKYHTYLYNEFRSRALPVKLLATDASPRERWETIEWAIANGMVPLSGVFGGHHYVNDFEPEDLDFYKIFKRHCSDVVNMLKPYERRFILGEFGLAQAFKQGKPNINGVKMDVCDAFYNGKEAYSALQMCEMALAAMNAGVYTMAMWTFTDLPNPEGLNYRLNKWGLTRWDGEDYSPRDWLYAYGLLVKYLKKNGKPFTVDTDDYLLRCGGVMNDNGTFSAAIVNRHDTQTDITVKLDGFKAHQAARVYVYDSANVPRNVFGDLQEPSAIVAEANGALNLTVPANSVVMVTTDYAERTPSAVLNVRHQDGMLSWDAVEDSEHVYYRVYRGETPDFVPDTTNQIASTIDTKLPADQAGYYQVKSVDCYGNC